MVVYQTNIGHKIRRRQDLTLARIPDAGLIPNDLNGSGLVLHRGDITMLGWRPAAVSGEDESPVNHPRLDLA